MCLQMCEVAEGFNNVCTWIPFQQSTKQCICVFFLDSDCLWVTSVAPFFSPIELKLLLTESDANDYRSELFKQRIIVGWDINDFCVFMISVGVFMIPLRGPFRLSNFSRRSAPFWTESKVFWPHSPQWGRGLTNRRQIHPFPVREAVEFPLSGERERKAGTDCNPE